MAITNASRLADFGSGIGTEGAVIQVDNTNKRVGIGTTNPLGMLQVGTGITMYTTGIGSFNSDLYVGGNLNVTGDLTYDEVTGVNINISGVGTIGTLGVSVATTSKDLLVTGVSTLGTLYASAGIITASAVRVSAATTTKDILVTGVSTFTGVVDSNDTTQSSSSTTGAAKFAGGVGVAKNLFVGGGAEVTGISTFTADVSIADKIIHTGDTNTALRFPSADTITGETGGTERMRITSNGGILLSNGILVERCKIVSTAWSTTNDISLDDGNVFLNTSNLAGTNNTIDITSTNGLNVDLADGDMTSVTLITAVNATTAYINAITIAAANVTESWVGGSAPTDGGGSGYDVYTFNIIKTGANQYVCIANQVKGS